jgi:hypothetical protein
MLQRDSFDNPTATGFAGMAPTPRWDVRATEEKKLNMVADLLLAGGARYRITPKQFSYAYLGASIRQRSSENFLTLLRDLFRLAAGAIRNRGAAMLAADPPKIMPYPSRHAFEEEITWFLWMKGGGELK